MVMYAHHSRSAFLFVVFDITQPEYVPGKVSHVCALINFRPFVIQRTTHTTRHVPFHLYRSGILNESVAYT